MTSARIRRLQSLLTSPSKIITHIHCHGPIECGAFDTICSLLDDYSVCNKNTIYAVASCAYADGNFKLLLKSISEGLKLDKNNVGSIEDFVSQLNNEFFLNERQHTIKLIVILRDADALSKFHGSTLDTLLSIPSLVPDASFRVVTCGERPWERIDGIESITNSSPISVAFENPSEEECFNLLCRALPNINKELIRYTISSLFIYCRDPNQMLRILYTACKEYEASKGEPIENMKEMKSRKLDPFIVVAQKKFDCFGRFDAMERDDAVLNCGKICSGSYTSLSISARYILVASFCASHNPAETDKRYFIKMHHKDKRSEARERAYELSNSSKENGIAVADLQRITFIYLSLLRLYPTKNCQYFGDINLQITSMCCMGLLARTTSATNLDVPRYRCLLSLDTAMEIAKSLHIPLRDHLAKKMLY